MENEKTPSEPSTTVKNWHCNYLDNKKELPEYEKVLAYADHDLVCELTQTIILSVIKKGLSYAQAQAVLDRAKDRLKNVRV